MSYISSHIKKENQSNLVFQQTKSLFHCVIKRDPTRATHQFHAALTPKLRKAEFKLWPLSRKEDCLRLIRDGSFDSKFNISSTYLLVGFCRILCCLPHKIDVRTSAIDANAWLKDVEKRFSDGSFQKLFITTRGFVIRDWGISNGSENLLENFLAFMK